MANSCEDCLASSSGLGASIYSADCVWTNGKGCEVFALNFRCTQEGYEGPRCPLELAQCGSAKCPDSTIPDGTCYRRCGNVGTDRTSIKSAVDSKMEQFGMTIVRAGQGVQTPVYPYPVYPVYPVYPGGSNVVVPVPVAFPVVVPIGVPVVVPVPVPIMVVPVPVGFPVVVPVGVPVTVPVPVRVPVPVIPVPVYFPVTVLTPVSISVSINIPVPVLVPIGIQLPPPPFRPPPIYLPPDIIRPPPIYVPGPEIFVPPSPTEPPRGGVCSCDDMCEVAGDCCFDYDKYCQ